MVMFFGGVTLTTGIKMFKYMYVLFRLFVRHIRHLHTCNTHTKCSKPIYIYKKKKVEIKQIKRLWGTVILLECIYWSFCTEYTARFCAEYTAHFCAEYIACFCTEYIACFCTEYIVFLYWIHCVFLSWIHCMFLYWIHCLRARCKIQYSTTSEWPSDQCLFQIK